MLEKDGEELPAPSAMSDIHPEELAAELESSADEAFLTMISVDVKAYAKEHFEKSVKKTLSIPAWLNKAALEQNSRRHSLQR